MDSFTQQILCHGRTVLPEYTNLGAGTGHVRASGMSLGLVLKLKILYPASNICKTTAAGCLLAIIDDYLGMWPSSSFDNSTTSV